VNDFTAMCGYTTRFSGKDVVYVFTATADGPVTATVYPSATFDPSLARLEGSCAPTSCVTSTDTGASGGNETMTFTAVNGTTYWFVVDGWSTGASSEGFFRFELK